MATATFTPISGRLKVQLFGVPYGNLNLATPDGRDNLGLVLEEQDITTVLAPKGTECNALICSPDELTEKVSLGEKAIALRGVNADGTVLTRPGQSFLITPADCMTIIMMHKPSGETIVMHASRDSLIDRHHIQSEKPQRTAISVVYSAFHYFMGQFSASCLKDISVFMTGTIGPDHFEHRLDHPTYGEANRKLVNHLISKYGLRTVTDRKLGKISLTEIARAQMISFGIDPHRIGFDLIDTGDDRLENGDYAWWSYRRSDTSTKANNKFRNAVLVTRMF